MVKLRKTKFKESRKELFYSLLLFAILLVPNFFVLFYFNEIKGNISMMMAYLALSIVVWVFPLMFLRKRVYFGLAFMFFLFSPLEIAFVRNLGIPMTEGYIESVFRTNFVESFEQITSNLPLLLLFVVLLMIYIFSFKRISNTFFDKKIRLGIALFFISFNLLLFINMIRIQPSKDVTISFKLKTAYKSTVSKYRKVYPTDFLVHTQKTLVGFYNNKKLREQIDEFKFNAKSNNEEDLDEVYVLILGESARYENFKINGYDRETTPRLDTLQNLLSFSNVYSNANVTTYSIPMMITRSTPHDLSVQNKEKTLLDAFHESGFYTAFIANQNSSYPVLSRLRNVADFTHSNPFDVHIKDFFDGEALSQLEEILSEENPKKFIMIHTLGSHFRYTSRYPKEFEKFQPVMNDTGYGDFDYNNKDKIVNAYDNTILYTDYFLSETIEQLNKLNQNVVLIYVSDHGQNLFDDDKKLIGHGSPYPTKYEYHVPFLVWYSNEYKERNSEKIHRLKENLNQKASTTSVFYTLLDLANISYDHSENEIIHSLSSETYKVPEVRYVLGTSKEIVELKN